MTQDMMSSIMGDLLQGIHPQMERSHGSLKVTSHLWPSDIVLASQNQRLAVMLDSSACSIIKQMSAHAASMRARATSKGTPNINRTPFAFVPACVHGKKAA
eukprot:TRINITY_DN32924_c0_g1_i1.p1 TRINITY_DN32924_c0_g1~~TRINITY_DN32924_c0_g1_i1.p1  ORF type:complete len:101 (+),score=8.73 TRINITY_DN32924_c0_g1_i1:141-443(+)